jgi:hypothetical protein
MAKRGFVVLVFAAVGLAMFASLGPRGRAGGQNSGQQSWWQALVAAAATVPTPVNGVIDENPGQSPTATATSTAAVRRGPLVRTVQIAPYNDASVASGGLWTPDTNLGGWNMLATGPESGGYFRSYIRFLVGGLPAGMQIDSALLYLTPVQGGAKAVPVAADFVQDDWNESTITWNQQPLTTFTTGATTWQPGSSTPVNIDVTSAVQQWYACGGTSNNGLMLSADMAQDGVAFGSRKSDTPPVLQVTYQTASAPVNCSAPPASNVNLAPPSSISPSTTGAQIGSFDPNSFNNPLGILSGTPYGAQSNFQPPSPPYAAQATSLAQPPLPFSTYPPGGPPSGLGTSPINLGGGSQSANITSGTVTIAVTVSP